MNTILLDEVVNHLLAAKMQRTSKDDRLICDHIDQALQAAKLARDELRNSIPVYELREDV